MGLRPLSLGLFKTAECGFYAMDPLSIGVRQFLATCNLPHMKETNPKLEVKYEIFKTPQPSFLKVTLLNDEVMRFEGKAVNLAKIMSKLQYLTYEFEDNEIYSEADKQLMKDIDNDIK